MENKDEMLLRHFFDNHRQEIVDEGFSNKVIGRLPVHSTLPYMLLQMACMLSIIVLCFACGGLSMLKSAWENISVNILSYVVSVDVTMLPPLSVLSAVVSLLVLPLLLLSERREYGQSM